LKKWTKDVVKKEYAVKRISKEHDKWVEKSEFSIKKTDDIKTPEKKIQIHKEMEEIEKVQ
jgi:hypothetical protein